MGSKPLPLTRFAGLWFPFFAILFVAVSSLALFGRLKLQEANGRIALLHRKLNELKVDISWIGERIPAHLFLLLKKAQDVTGNNTNFMVLYFISPSACEACMEEDIETFKNLRRLQRGVSIFFVGPDIGEREEATLVHRYRISFPCYFVKYAGEEIRLYRAPTTVLCDSAGRVLVRYAPEFADTSWNRIYREALFRIVGK